ncbi:hypothetical protein PIB30_061901 [Stylosanthes scabra]|uniref:Pentatricopeptide repeat-containing protein n=1 Tax=Stylosanthes scabra TaxID=79078 RepID=A0ABU6WKK6_9FABA|nr:hypothetical protein [Stylosanthes scabra]
MLDHRGRLSFEDFIYLIHKSDIFVVNFLLDFHCKSADMVVSHKLFDTIAVPNVVPWNIMISRYRHNSVFENSWEMFFRMHLVGIDPSEFSYGSVLSACVALQDHFDPIVISPLRYIVILEIGVELQ